MGQLARWRCHWEQEEHRSDEDGECGEGAAGAGDRACGHRGLRAGICVCGTWEGGGKGGQKDIREWRCDIYKDEKDQGPTSGSPRTIMAIKVEERDAILEV